MIRLENVTKSFGDLKAVDNLSFEVEKGEIVGFLGPNGAGKTTTMRMITGFLYPDEGVITVEGITVQGNDQEAQREIGYLPENNPLYKDLLVSEFLRLSADLKQIPQNKQKDAFDFVVSATGIGEVFYKPIRELSKGYRQRVGLACALIHKPGILILDEPTEGLDPNQRSEVRNLIRQLSRDHTIVLSTHVMQEVTAVCSRLLIINRGRLVADGSTAELASQARAHQIIELNIEGNNVVDELKLIDGVEQVDVLEGEDSRWRINLHVRKGVEIRPSISQLIRKNDWIVWKLAEQEQNLEDLFQELTRGDR